MTSWAPLALVWVCMAVNVGLLVVLARLRRQLKRSLAETERARYALARAVAELSEL